MDDQQSNLVCCHNDNLAFSHYMVLIISSVSGIVNVMCLVMLAAVCLFNLCSLGAIMITQWAHWFPDYKMWNHRISRYTGGIPTESGIWGGYFPLLLKYHVALCIWFSGIHIKCYLEYAASTINACSTGIPFHFTENYYLVKHILTGLNIIKPRNCYPCVTQNGFINKTEDCNAFLVRFNHC